jgi:hypothetical protein
MNAPAGKYTFVTVVFEAEYDLLRLQARSMRLYLPRDLTQQIIIMENSTRPAGESTRRVLLEDYGELKDLVRFFHYREIGPMPRTDGWRSQQILKLAIADHIGTDRYVTLDAKNHFVYPLERRFLEAPDGRATVNTYSFRKHPLKNALDHVLRYLGLDPEQYLDQFSATVTPFTLYTGIVRQLMQDIEKQSGKSFADEFIQNNLTEFFLYSGWLFRRGELERLYQFHQVFCPGIWEHTADARGCGAAIAKAGEQHTPLFAVHRCAMNALDEQALSLLAAFWTDRRLFDAPNTARAFIIGQRTAYARHEQAKHSYKARFLNLPRRVVRKLQRMSARKA